MKRMAMMAAVLAALAGPAAAQTKAPCAGLVIEKLRAPVAPVTDAAGAVLTSVKALPKGEVLAVVGCTADETAYRISWEGGEGQVRRALVMVRGMKAGDSLRLGAKTVRRATSKDVQAAALAPAPGTALPTCESASATRGSESDRLFGAMGLSSAGGAPVCAPAN